MADRTYSLNIIADIADYQREMAKIPGYTDEMAALAAQKWSDRMQRAADKAERAAEKAARDAAKAAERAEKSWSEFSDSLGDSESALIGIADIVGMISPELANSARAAADMGGGLEGIIKGGKGLLAVMGPVAVVIGAVTLAYDQMQAAAERAAAEQATFARSNELVRQSSIQLQDALIGLQVATGQISEAEAERMRIGNAAREQIVENGKALTEQRAELREQITSYETWTDVLNNAGLNVVRFGDTAKYLLGWNTAVGSARTQLNALADAEERSAQLTKQSVQAQRDAATATERAAKTQSLATPPALDYADAVGKINEELEQALKQEDLTKTLVGFSESLQEAAKNDPLTVLARQRQESLTKLEQINNDRVDLASENYGELLGLEQAYQAERAEVIAFYDQQIADTRAKIEAEAAENAMAALKAEREETLNSIVSTAQQATDILSSLSEFETERRQRNIEKLQAALESAEEGMSAARRQAIEDRLEAEKQAALRAFRFQQAAAIAQITISTAEGVAKALAQYGLPFGLIPAGLIGASGAAQIAVVASQSPPEFHTGGLIAEYSGSRNQRGEVDIRALPGEGVVNQAGMSAIGEDGLRQINQGRAPNQTVFVQYRHQLFDATVRDSVRVPGSELNKLKTSNTRRGIRG